MKFKDSTEGTKNLLKLKDKDTIRGVFRGEIYDFRQHWEGNKSFPCPGKTQCDKCAKGDKSSFRFKVNFIIKENGMYIAKVWDQGWTVYQLLKALHEGG